MRLQLACVLAHLSTCGWRSRCRPWTGSPAWAGKSNNRAVTAPFPIGSFLTEFKKEERTAPGRAVFMSYKTRISRIYDQSDCTLNPGEPVEHSGIYEICHSDEPRTSLLLLRNSVFPFCRKCGHAVRYKLVQAAPHISEDPDFNEELAKTDNSVLNQGIPTSLFPTQLGIAHGFRFLQEVAPAWGAGTDNGNL